MEYVIPALAVFVGAFWVVGTCFINAHGFDRKSEFDTCRTMWVVAMLTFIITPLLSDFKEGGSKIVWTEGGEAVHKPLFAIVSVLTLAFGWILIGRVYVWTERRSERKRQERMNEPLEDILERIENADYRIESGGGSLWGHIPSIETSDQANQLVDDILGEKTLRKLKGDQK